MKLLSYYKDDGFWWFRICGYGLHGKNIKKHPLVFSERNRYVKFLSVGNWVIKTLKPQSR